MPMAALLSFISILHQTTTGRRGTMPTYTLSFISILHQTTTTAGGTFDVIPDLSFISILHQTTTELLSIVIATKLSFISILHQTTTVLTVLIRVDGIVLHLYSTSNHNVYLLILLFTDICVHSYVYEVVEIDYLLCKNTKKILIAMGLALIFSLLLPKCE